MLAGVGTRGLPFLRGELGSHYACARLCGLSWLLTLSHPWLDRAP